MTLHTMLACHGVTTAGAERTLVTMAAAAVARGDEVTFVVPRDGPVVELLRNDVPAARVRHRPMQWWMGMQVRGACGLARTTQALLQTASWVTLLRRTKPDILIVGSSVTPAPLAAACLVGVPVAAVLGESILTNPTLPSILPKSLIIRLLHRWSDVTVSVSRFAAAQYGGTTLIEAPDIGSPEELAGPDPDAGGVGARAVVMLGTLSSEKGQLDAVRAMGLLPSSCRDVTLTFWGDADPADLAELKALVDALELSDRVSYCGTTGTPRQVLGAADLSVVCSRNEAYGRVTAESLLVGTPVLGYALGATPEILAEGGGVLVEASPSALASELERLATQPQAFASLASAARERGVSSVGFGDAGATLARIQAHLVGAPS